MADETSDRQREKGRDLISEAREDANNETDLIGHFYRAEVDRSTAWRQRLDQTTNWAVVIVAAILTWTFSSQDNPHYVLLIGMFATAAFLLIEAHRFREYDIWRSRVRALQKNLFSGVLFSQSPGDEWQKKLGESLNHPQYTLSFQRAVAHRLRRTYFPLLLILFLAWFARITVFQTDEPWYQTAGLPGVPGEIVVITVGIVYLLLTGLVVWSAMGTEAIEVKE